MTAFDAVVVMLVLVGFGPNVRHFFGMKLTRVEIEALFDFAFEAVDEFFSVVVVAEQSDVIIIHKNFVINKVAFVQTMRMNIRRRPFVFEFEEVFFVEQRKQSAFSGERRKGGVVRSFVFVVVEPVFVLVRGEERDELEASANAEQRDLVFLGEFEYVSRVFFPKRP